MQVNLAQIPYRTRSIDMRFTFLFVIGFLITIASAQDIAIVGGRIEIGNGKSIANGTVIIRGGKIVEVSANPTIPEGMAKVDATGLVVYPGFIDGYVAKGLKLPDVPAAATPPSNLTSAPATMWPENRKGIRSRINVADCLDLKSILPDAHKAGITSALLAAGSGLARGRTALAFMTDEQQKAIPSFHELSFRGTGGGGGGGGGGGTYPGTLLGFTSLLRQTLSDAQLYAESSSTKEDLDLKGLNSLVKKEAAALFAIDSESDIYRSMQVAAEFGFSFGIYGGRDAYKRADQLAEMKVPVMLNIALGEEPSVTVQPDGPPLALLEERRATWRERATNAVQLDRAKVQFAFSSEGDGYGDYLKNIRRLIQLGLPKDSALRAMTITPATILGQANSLGTIEKGKVGNLVLMSKDFVDDQSVVNAVVVMGKKFEVAK